MDDLAPGHDLLPPMPPALRCAVAHLRTHLDRALTLREIAASCGLSQRTLHKWFHRFLGVPPLAYHRRLRLLAARAALARAECGSVSETANRFGFFHFGRFAADYRASFGEVPSVTRRGGILASPRVSAPKRPSVLLAPLRSETLDERAWAEDLRERLAAALLVLGGIDPIVPGPSGWARPAGPADSGARYILTGRFVLRCGAARVILSLTDRASARQVWGESFDAVASDWVGLQSKAAMSLCRAVSRELLGLPSGDVADTIAQSREAGYLRAQGIALALKVNVASARQLVAAMCVAMELQPDAAWPLALAAMAEAQIVNYLGTDDPLPGRTRAVALSAHAARLDTGDPLVTMARAAVASLLELREEAEALAIRAVAMDPCSHWAWERRGHQRLRTGDPLDIAIADFERALTLKPAGLPRANALLGIATAHVRAERPDRALRFVGAAMAHSPAPWMRLSSVWAHALTGERDQAKREMTALRRALPELTLRRVTTTWTHMPDRCYAILYEAGLRS